MKVGSSTKVEPSSFKHQNLPILLQNQYLTSTSLNIIGYQNTLKSEHEDFGVMFKV